MNKTEIQWRILALQAKFDSEMTSLKADLAKCDCEDKAQAGGIEQEMCWHRLVNGGVWTIKPETKDDVILYSEIDRPAYMPECRQVTAEDALDVWSAYCRTSTSGDMARELHKLGFRMKVNP